MDGWAKISGVHSANYCKQQDQNAAKLSQLNSQYQSSKAQPAHANNDREFLHTPFIMATQEIGANVKPTIIGDGLEALKDLGISKELRYDIHTALGTRHLLEDENFATASARERQFYTITVVPDARLIQYAFNEQILHPIGLHLEFEPERLEIFQEDEGEAAKSFGELFGIFKEVMSVSTAFELASQKLDYQFTDEQKRLIDKGIKEKDEENAQAQEDMKPKDETTPPEIVKALVELDKWEAKTTAAKKMVAWHPVNISVEMVKAIKTGAMTFEQARAEIPLIELAKTINGLL